MRCNDYYVCSTWLGAARVRSFRVIVDPCTPGGFWPVIFTYTRLTFSARATRTPHCSGLAAPLRRDIHIREAAHKCQENQPNSRPRVRKESWREGRQNFEGSAKVRRFRSIDRHRNIHALDDCENTNSKHELERE